MPRSVDPIAEALAANPLAPARPGEPAPVMLSDLDLRDLAHLVLGKVNHARTKRDQAHTGRRRIIADEEVRKWWRLFNRLVDARGKLPE